MKCRICGAETQRVFDQLVLNRHNVGYHRCSGCGYVCTDQPFWLGEAYARPINLCDTGIISRNEQLRDALVFLFKLHFKASGRFLDYAGGYGLLTRMMRDCGYDFYWQDPYTENILARGFEAREEHVPYTAMTCCECFEHFVEPLAEVEKQLRLSRTIFFTTSLIPSPPPAPGDWDYYGFSHGQHVSFYTAQSLAALARRLGLGFSSSGRQLHCIGENPPSPLLMRIACSPPVRLLQLPLRKLNGSLMQADHKCMRDRVGVPPGSAE